MARAAHAATARRRAPAGHLCWRWCPDAYLGLSVGQRPGLVAAQHSVGWQVLQQGGVHAGSAVAGGRAVVRLSDQLGTCGLVGATTACCLLQPNAALSRTCSMVATTSSRGLGWSRAVAARDMSGMVKGWMRLTCREEGPRAGDQTKTD